MTNDTDVLVVAIDGLTGTGKTTVRGGVALELGFHEHDSGALFRAVGYIAHRRGVTSELGCAEIASRLKIHVRGEKVYLDGFDRTNDLRSTECGNWAAVVARMAAVHESLRTYQLGLRRLPGLAADGRDMCFVYDTPYRFVLKTESRVRARRRVAQMERLRQPADFDAILQSIEARDKSDIERAVNPFKIHPDATVIHTDDISVEATVHQIAQKVRKTSGLPLDHGKRKLAFID